MTVKPGRLYPLRAHVECGENLDEPMNKIIDFPDKVFLEWGAVAQELVPYLKGLGANKEEARRIIDKVRGRWDQPGTPAVSDLAPVVFIRRSDDRMSLFTPPFDASGLHAGRRWKSENARTLLALARFEYQASST
jgi:hypothetical protein